MTAVTPHVVAVPLATFDARPISRPNRRRPEPLWHQVEQSIREAITSGAWAPGSQLPGEEALCVQLGVSRITIRHALANLVNQGLLRREHGRGTFVRSARLVAGARGLTSFTEEMAALGMVATTTLLGVGVAPASRTVADALEIDGDAPVMQVRRLRLGDGEPIGVQTAHLRLDRVPGLDAETLGDSSLYDVLRERYGITPVVADETYRVATAGSEAALLLHVKRGVPVFMVTRVTSDERGPFEVTTSTMRGDRYEIRSTLRL